MSRFFDINLKTAVGRLHTWTTFSLCAFLMESMVSAVMKPNFWYDSKIRLATSTVLWY